jgi:glycosyltransferase involved in cell wall biosynthesis
VKIAFVSTYPPIHCGIGEYTRFLVTALSGIYPSGQYFVLAEEGVGEGYVDKSANAKVIPTFRKRKAETYQNIVEVLDKIGGVDVLHIQHEYDIFSGHRELLEVLFEARERGLAKVILITLHSVHHPFSPDETKWNAVEFQRSLPEYMDKVIVHSPPQEFELQSQGLPYDIIHRIPHGTFVNPHLAEPRLLIAKRLNIELSRLERPIISLAGFLHRHKGIDVLAEALEHIKSDRFTLIIGGELRDESVKKYLSELGKGRLIFTEKYLSSDEILSIAALADIIVMPYHDIRGLYSVSGILHLSMGSLKPIIGTRVPKLVELYSFAPQLTIPPMDPKALAKKMIWVMENYDVAVAYASHLYSYAVRTQWNRVARRHLNLYRSLLKERERSSTGI